jgi:serine/threonine protein kinase
MGALRRPVERPPHGKARIRRCNIVLSASPEHRVRVTNNQPPAAPRSFGRFELLERVGAGGMAEVFRAQVHGPEGFKRELVVKRVLPHLSTRSRFTQMFVNEAKISALLSHPNIVQIFEFGESDGCYFIAMESIRGLTLREVLTKLRTREAMMPVVAAMEIAREILVALDYAHNLPDLEGRPLGIVHRDISPSNVMLANNGAVKVLDFGIARAADLIEEDDHRIVKGKVAYLAPEQIALTPVDARADVFALGCVLFEMLTGRLLFRAQNDLQKKLVLLAQPSPAASAFNLEVPPAVDAIVLRAVERGLDTRYESAADMLIDVENYLSSFRSASRSVLRLVRSLGDPPDLFESSSQSSAPPSEPSHRTGSSVAARTVASPPSARARTAIAPAPMPAAASGGSTALRASVVEAPSAPPSLPAANLAGAGYAERARVGRVNSQRRWGNLGARLMAVAVAAVVIIGIGLGGRALFARLARHQATVASAAPAPLPAAFVLVTFFSRPPEARIFDAQSSRLLGMTPATLPVTQAHRLTRFRFEKDGYLPVIVESIPDSDKTLNVVLRQAPPGASQSASRRKVPRKQP